MRRIDETSIVSDTENEAIMRLAGRLMLDHVTVARFGFDLVDALVLLTITQANVEPIVRDPELQRRYAIYAQPPPDDLRRPISINAVSQSLGLPFETVRRRVLKMMLLGIFRSTPQGVVTPSAVVLNERHRMAQESGYERTRALHRVLDESGLGESYDAAPVWTGPEPLRLIARVSGEYLLRLVQLLMAETGDPLSAAVWLAIYCDNVAVGDRGASHVISGGHKPMNMAQLAKRLRLPTETTRRRVQALVAQGLCVQAGPHVFVDSGILARPGIQRLLNRNRQDLRRMFSTLAEYGIPQAWRAAERPASSAAA